MSERNPRFPAKYPVVLRRGPDMFPAVLCNISIGGGCIVGAQKFAKGETATLDYSVGQTRATVMWSTGKMAGLKFESELSSTGLNCIRAIKAEA